MIIHNGDLISCDANSHRLYIHSGLSSTLTGSFRPIAANNLVRGLTIDENNNVFVSDASFEQTHYLDKVNPSIINSFANPTVNLQDITILSNQNLVMSSQTSSYFFNISGNGTVLGSFSAPKSSIFGITQENGNLISSDSFAGFVYLHDGISSTLTGSFSSAVAYGAALCMDLSGNLISANTSDSHIYLHSGISATLTGSFSTPADFGGGGGLFVYAGSDLIIGKVNIGDEWKKTNIVRLNIGDDWKVVDSCKINIGDSWKTVF